jgi:hypothetical protein
MSGPESNPTPDERRPALGADLIIPVLAAAFTIYFLASSAGLVWEARANGTLIGICLLALILLQVVRVAAQVRAGRATLGFGSLLERSTAQYQRLGILLILIAFVVTIPWLGTTLGLFLVMIAAMWVLGVREWRTLIGIAFAVAASVYILFIALLASRLPTGPVERLLAPIFQ